MASVIQSGALAEEIGTEGVAEALRRGWIAPNFDSGGLQATNNLGVVQEMEKEASEKCSKCDKVECECKEDDDDGAKKKKEWQKPWEKNESHSIASSHSTRRLHEMAAYGSGQPDRPAASPVPPPNAAPPAPAPTSPVPAATSQQQAPVNIGDSVLVAEGGETYVATVSAKNQDGSYKLSFGSKRPSRERAYKENEMRKTQDGTQAAR